MKIAYLTTDFGIPVYGNKGASIHVREMSLALRDMGHEVRILTPRLGGEAPDGFDIPVHEVKLAKAERAAMSEIKDDPASTASMAKEIRSVVYAATLRSRARDLFSEWRPGAIYERYSLLASAGADLAQELDIPFILEVNAPLSEEAAKHRGLTFRQTVENVESVILKSADAIVAVSEEVKAWVISRGVEPGQIHVLPNGVNAAKFQNVDPGFRKSAGLDDRPTVGFVGTLKKWHGTETLVRAVAEIRRRSSIDSAPRLLIVGDGPERESLEYLAKAERIADLVTFTGSVDHTDVPAWISAMDIAVAPYDALDDFYFSPLKLFEYMAAGKAIVASDIGQINSCMQHGDTGLLYEPGNVLALADTLEQILKDKPLAIRLGESARERAMHHHSWLRNADTVTKLIDGHRVSGETNPIVLEGAR